MVTTPAPATNVILPTGSSPGPWPVGFVFASATELVVRLVVGGVIGERLTLNVDFTVSASDPLVNGGEFTLDPSAVPGGGWGDGDKVAVTRQTALRQPLALPDTEQHKPRATESGLDLLTRIAQEQAEVQHRSLTLPIGAEGGDIPWSPELGERFVTVGADGKPGVTVKPDDFDGLNKTNRNADNVGDKPEFRKNIGLINLTFLDDIGVYGGSGGDAAENATNLRAALLADPNRVLRARNAELYNLGETAIPAGARIVADTALTPILNLPAGVYTNTDPVAKTGATVVGLDLSGETTGGFAPNTDILIEGVCMRFDGPDGRAVRFIRADNVENLVLRGLTFEGLGVGRAVVANRLSGDWLMEDLTFRDFYANADMGAGSQITCIEFDDDKPDGVATVGGRIVNCSARDIVMGPALLAARGDQTDFITIGAGMRGVSIINPQGYNVGEMIDCWGDEIDILAPQFEQARLFGLKFIHGAQRCRSLGGYVKGFGRAGVVFAGSTTRARDISDNQVDGISVSEGDAASIYAAGSAALLFETPPGYVGNILRNLVRNSRLAGDGAAWAVRDADNLGVGNRVIGTTTLPGTAGRVLASAPASVTYQSTVPTLVLATASAGQSVAAGAQVDVTFGTESADSANEFDPATSVYTFDTPKAVRLKAAVRLEVSTAGVTHALYVLKKPAGGAFADAAAVLQRYSETQDLSIAIDRVFVGDAGDQLKVQFVNGDGVTRSLSENPLVKYLEITEIPRAV